MADGCHCGDPGSFRTPSRSRAVPRMGTSSLAGRPPMKMERRLPPSPPPPPRPLGLPRMAPRTVPGLQRSYSKSLSPCRGDRTLTPGAGDRTLTAAVVRSPDFTKFGSTMEELSKLEFVEMQNIEEDLRNFHMKRRKLVFNIASINLSKAKKSIKKAVSKMGFK